MCIRDRHIGKYKCTWAEGCTEYKSLIGKPKFLGWKLRIEHAACESTGQMILKKSNKTKLAPNRQNQMNRHSQGGLFRQ